MLNSVLGCGAGAVHDSMPDLQDVQLDCVSLWHPHSPCACLLLLLLQVEQYKIQILAAVASLDRGLAANVSGGRLRLVCTPNCASHPAHLLTRGS